MTEQELFEEFQLVCCDRWQPFIVDVVQFLAVRCGHIPTIEDVASFIAILRGGGPVGPLVPLVRWQAQTEITRLETAARGEPVNPPPRMLPSGFIPKSLRWL